MSDSGPTAAEAAALRSIAASSDPKLLQTQLDNAQGKSALVERAAFDRIVELKAKTHDHAVARDCWLMIHAIEEIRRLKNGKRVPMNRLRRKIEKDGEVVALAYLAIHESAGFEEVIGYGVPELLAEVLVVRHGQASFAPEVIESARARLLSRGLLIDDLVATLLTRTSGK